MNLPEDFSNLIDDIKEFEKDHLKICMAMTFSVEAWEELKVKFDKISFDEQVFIHGLPCYVLQKQQQECIGWYNSEALNMWLEAENSEHIEKLPEIKSIESD